MPSDYSLHDAILDEIIVDWAVGAVRLRITPHDLYPEQASEINASGLLALTLTRAEPWGPSARILECEGPSDAEDGRQLVITMQSGDEVSIVARHIDFDGVRAG